MMANWLSLFVPVSYTHLDVYKRQIYIVRKTIDGWLIYTNCKNGDKDCLIITSTNSFKPTIENEIIRQEPTYWLEEIK